ncbi:MAG: hypothetical protein QOI91_1665 [Solirubrobacteraceae bacterium]|jgi:uncharacterized protein YbcI|nr:hypothetical protein [Solirubrobacteraceae bacterium]
MPGFDFRRRVGGGSPTVRTYPGKDAETVTTGDLLCLTAGAVVPATTGSGDLLGAAVATSNGSPEKTFVDVIVDADAVYAVTDGFDRAQGDSLDLTGVTGAQGVAGGVNGDLLVVALSAVADETLVRVAPGRHADDSPSSGALNAALARAAVRVYRDYVGRGPTKAQAFFRGNVVVVLMHDVMTTAERSLATGGRSEVVLDMRRQLGRALRPDLVAAVERLTGCRVTASMGASHVDPDLAAEVFVLDRDVPTRRPPGPAG